MLIDIIGNIILSILPILITITQAKIMGVRIENSTWVYLGVFFVISLGIITPKIDMNLSALMLIIGFMLGIINKD